MNDEVCFKNYSYNNKAYLTCKSQQNEMYYKCDFFSKRRKKAFSISMRVKSALDPPTNQNVFFQFFTISSLPLHYSARVRAAKVSSDKVVTQLYSHMKCFSLAFGVEYHTDNVNFKPSKSWFQLLGVGSLTCVWTQMIQILHNVCNFI